MVDLEFATFDTPVGGQESTVRRGRRPIAAGDPVTFRRNGVVVGRGYVTGVWAGPLGRVPMHYVLAEHDPGARTRAGLLRGLGLHYPGITEDDIVTAIIYKRDE